MVTAGVPQARVRRSESRLERMVQAEMTIVTMPMYDTGTPSSPCMAGQPDPSRESGRPRLIKAR